MKYKLSLAAVAIALLASCTEAEIVEQSESMKITFETYIGKNNNTRGMPITNTKFAADSTLRIFGVIKDNANALDATWNNNSFTSISGMTADAGAIYKKLNGDNNNWTGETISYWVPGKYHTFFAYAPAEASNLRFSKGNVTYVVADSLKDQIDFMVADTVANKLYTTGTTPAPITFTFRHLLSQVKFKVIFADDYTSNSFRLTNDVAAKEVRISLAESGKFSNTGSVNLLTKSNDADFEPIATVGSIDSYKVTPTNPVNIEFKNYLNGDGADTIAVNGLGGNDILMLMPQAMNKKLQVALDLTLTKDGTKQGVTANFITTNNQTWKSNKIYTYILVLNMPAILNMQPIIVGDPTIIDWTKPEIETVLTPTQI